jgi:hypothetical protein
VEVRNTPLKEPVPSRDSAVLIEDLGLALRGVAVFNGHLPDGAVIVEKIDNVKAIVAELSKRSIDVIPTLGELSIRTNLKKADLLADCLAYPTRMPYEKGLDGVRERFRCPLCRKEEHAEETLIYMCEGCLDRTLSALETRTPFPGLFLYRTYSESKRCPHADPETVLVTVLWSDEDWFETGRCKQCLMEEKRKRLILAEESQRPN